MTMDGTGTPSPTPQCVGREFVRQYYTLLNEAPQYVHRFYSHNSSFIHGGDDRYEEENPPVIGQADIHNKIQSMNFKNCHAKIRFVDSQATIGTGVVVQVTGELSNDGKPLRRFMQTFVLAPQSANKYYVHNDIFRYQDEAFCDSDEEDEYEPEQPQPHQTVASSAGRQNHSNTTESDSPKAQDEFYQPHPSSAMPQPPADMNSAAESSQSAPAEPPLTNGHHPAHLAPETPTQTPAPSEPETHEPPVTMHHHEPEPELTVSTPDDDFLNQSAHSPGSQNMSWARLVDQSERQALAQAGGMQTGHQTGGSNNLHNMEGFPSEKPDLQRATMRNNRPDGSLTKGFGDMSIQNDSAPSGMPPRMDDRRMDDRRMDDRRMDRVRYPHNHQIFVGNLPHQMNESELRSTFKDYGNILEVRITRSTGSSKVPFGFVVFDNETSAQSALSLKTVEVKPGHRVNIEKKAANYRSSSGPRQGGRRDNQRFHRGNSGGGGRGGFGGGGSREDGRNRPDQGQGRYYNNKSSPPYHQ